jgi:hypothetical protein
MALPATSTPTAGYTHGQVDAKQQCGHQRRGRTVNSPTTPTTADGRLVRGAATASTSPSAPHQRATLSSRPDAAGRTWEGFVRVTAQSPHSRAKQCYGKAVITAALDARRVGAHHPVTWEFFKAAVPAYLTPAQQATAPQDWLDGGVDHRLGTHLHWANEVIDKYEASVAHAGALVSDREHMPGRDQASGCPGKRGVYGGRSFSSVIQADIAAPFMQVTDVLWCPRWDSNPHCRRFELRSSAGWDTGTSGRVGN